MTRRGAVTRRKSRHGAAMGTFASKHGGSGLSEYCSVAQDWQIPSRDDRAGITLRKLGRRTGAGGWFPLTFVRGLLVRLVRLVFFVPGLTHASSCWIDESCISRLSSAMGREARKEQSGVTRSHWHAISHTHTQSVDLWPFFWPLAMEPRAGPQVFGSKEKESVSTGCTTRGMVQPDFTDETGQAPVVSNTTVWCQSSCPCVAPLNSERG